jgi:hypothetical protein
MLNFTIKVCPYILVEIYECIGGTCFLLLQDRRVSFAWRNSTGRGWTRAGTEPIRRTGKGGRRIRNNGPENEHLSGKV